MPNVPTMALLKYCTQLKKIDVCIFYLMPDSEKSYCVPYHFFTASIRINLTIQENVVNFIKIDPKWGNLRIYNGDNMCARS